MGTGHEGSLCTLHANSASDALARVVSMTLLADIGLPVSAIESQVARSVDLVVHVQRSAGKRRIVEVARVIGDREGIRAEPIEIRRFGDASE
jgi:pilus assembly protein CpaF